MTETGEGDGDLGVRRPSALLKTARDPAAPPERLRRIVDVVRHASSGPRRAVLEAVASNPNAPPDVLAELVRTCPDAVRANPALPLLALEAPDCAALMDEARLRELLRDPSLPAGLLSVIAADGSRPELASEAKMHVGLAGEACDGWQDEVREWFRAHVRACSVPAGVISLEFCEVGLGPEWLREELDRNPARPRFWGEDESFWQMRERAALLKSIYASDLPRAKMDAIVAGRDRHAHWGLALNLAVPPELIRRLARNAPDTIVLLALAQNPNTPPDVLTQLAASDLNSVRRWALRHASTPPEAWEIARVAMLRSELRWRGGQHRRQWFPSLVRYVALTQAQADPAWLAAIRRAADGDQWHERLAAVVALPEAEVPALVTPLADDGNRLVRAAARARLADPAGKVLTL